MSFLRHILGRKALLVGNSLVLVLLVWGLYGELRRSNSLQADIDRLQTQARALETQNARLTTLGKELATNERLEREARTKLGLQKPGESVVVVQSGTTTSNSAAPLENNLPISDNQNQLSNPEKWWRYFFANP